MMINCRRSFAIVALSLAAPLAFLTQAVAAEELYRAQTVVTGQGEANRMIGFASCMEDVLIKVSGAQKLAGDRRLAAYKSKAKDFVSAFSYRDQFSGKPTRDEQGTRDRPFDLTVDFDKEKIDGVLKVLGLKPWPSQRPVLAALVRMEQGNRKFIVTTDGTQSDLQRDALLAAAAKLGMGIMLPSEAAMAKSSINGAELRTTPPSTLASFAADQGGEVALVGRLVWNDRELGWATQWQIDQHGRRHRWQLRGVTFDEAFRRGIGGALQVLSNNGEPESRVRH
ncbi:MAG TPA: DUF2066 domain-containing protein [Bradyrhizobium sp.]|nr:DUF2066 domain-containing protein [Bradyrhizobium sp.]